MSRANKHIPRVQCDAEQLMVTAAVRYCLGRQTYIVGSCADWLIEQWPAINERTRSVIKRDVEEAIKDDDEARATGSKYKPLGWDCDREQWLRVRALWGAA